MALKQQGNVIPQPINTPDSTPNYGRIVHDMWRLYKGESPSQKQKDEWSPIIEKQGEGALKKALAGSKKHKKWVALGPEGRDLSRASDAVKTFGQGEDSPIDTYNQALEQLGMSDARTRVQGMRQSLMNTESLLQNLDQDVTGRVQQSSAPVTESQRRRLLASEQAPLSQQVGEQSRALETAQADYGMIQDEAGTQAEMQFAERDFQYGQLIDRLETAIGQVDRKEDKRRFQKQLEVAKKERQQEQKRWDKEFSESKRQFNLGHSLSQQKAATTASRAATKASKAASKRPSQTQALQAIGGTFKPGGDGYVSPNQWNSLRQQFINAGYSPAKFESQFKSLINPAHFRRSDLQNYQISHELRKKFPRQAR